MNSDTPSSTNMHADEADLPAHDARQPILTTNGASSGNRLYSAILGWMVPIRKHELGFEAVDSLLSLDFDSVTLDSALVLLRLSESSRKLIVDYVSSRRAHDMAGVALAMQGLLDDPSSPFYLDHGPPVQTAAKGLPPPTVTAVATDRHRASTRASQIISQYTIEQFAGDSDGASYMRWKFAVLDVLDILRESGAVRLEAVLQSLSPAIRLRVQKAQPFAPTDDADLCCAAIIRHLDQIYLTPTAVRFIESDYFGCKMKPAESLHEFVDRHQAVCRIFERATSRVLSERDKIAGFMAGLTTYKTTAVLLDTLGCPNTLTEYVQKFLALATISKPAAELNAVETRGKRARTEHSTDAATAGRDKPQGLGCYRCCEKAHIALTCQNEVKDFDSRCHKCGSRKHKQDTCRTTVKRACRRCGGQHFESICPKQLSAAPPNPMRATSNNAILEETEFDKLQALLSTDQMCVTVIDCGRVDIVDTSPPTAQVSISGSDATPALLDTGAGANFIHPQVVSKLFRQGHIKKSDTFELVPPLRVRFGNGQEGQTNAALRAHIKIGAKNCLTTFAIYADVSPQLILGRPAIKTLGLFNFDFSTGVTTGTSAVTDIAAVSVQTSPIPWIEPRKSENDPTKEQLFVRFPLYESCLFEPIREPVRARNALTEKIILARLLAMEREGCVQACGLQDCPYVCPVVLIDKKAEQHLPRTYPDPELHARYRITVDMRGYNALQLHETADSKAYLLPKALFAVTKKPKSVSQYQASAYEIVRHMPISKARYFSKLDLKDAFASVKLPREMQHCAVECFDSEMGAHRHFRFTSLIQGWRFSPLYFRMTAEFLVSKCRAKLRDRGLLSFVFTAYFQDDIIVLSDDGDRLREATGIMVSVLRYYSFSIRDEKVILCATQLTFCGYTLSDHTAIPTPTRRKFTETFQVNLWNEFVLHYPGDTSGITSWLRSVAGCFQYLYGFLPPSGIQALTTLYRNLSTLGRGGVLHVDEYKRPFDHLCEYVINGLPRLFLGAFSDCSVVCSVIVSDANADAWSALLLKLVVPPTTDTISEQIMGDLEALRVTLSEHFEIPDTAVFLPVRMFGGKFSKTQQKQSSTYRERVSQLYALDESLPLLQGPTVVVGDNRNCCQRWHDNEEILGGSLLGKWNNFCAYVDLTLWVARDGLPSLADFAARIIAGSTSPPPVAEEARVDKSNPDLEEGDVLDSALATVDQVTTTNATLIDEIVAGCSHDTDSTYQGVPMHIIYQAKIVGENESSVKAAKFFELDGNKLLWYLSSQAPRLYVPNVRTARSGGVSLRGYILKLAHCQADLHFGIAKTTTQAEWAWWPGMSKDLPNFVLSCWKCISSRSALVKSHFVTAFSSTTAFASAPFAHWSIDHFSFNDRQILVAICGFSHFMTAQIVRSTDSISTAVALLRVFAMFGLPLSLHSDRGSGFTGAVITELCQLLNIDTSLSPRQFPRCNGLCEKAGGTLKTLLRTASADASNLETPLALSVLRMNSSRSTRTDLAPYEAAFGLPPRKLDVVLLPTPCDTPFSYEVQHVTRRLCALRMAEHLTDTQNASLMDSRVSSFRPGDMVYVVAKADSGLTHVKIRGPYCLLSKVGSGFSNGAAIWRCIDLSAEVPKAEDISEAILKRLVQNERLQEFKDLIPPIAPPITDKASLSPSDLIVVKKEGADSCELHSIRVNDPTTGTLTTFVWCSNASSQFYRTNLTATCAYGEVVCRVVLTRERRIPAHLNI